MTVHGDPMAAGWVAVTHLAAGASFAAWLVCRIQTRRPIDALDHLAGVALTFLGALAAVAVAYDIAVHGLRPQRPVR